MSKVKYIKVNTADRLPEKEGHYYVFRADIGMCIVNFVNGDFYSPEGIEYWLEPVPDREEEMREMLERIVSFSSLGEKIPDFLTHELEKLLNELKPN